MNQCIFDLTEQKPLSQKVVEAESMLKEYYLNDKRPFVLAYSGGKDSNAILHLLFSMLLQLRSEKIKLKKRVVVVTSDTLAELPPMLQQIKNSLADIRVFVKKNKLPVDVFEVSPQLKNTLNVQLLGVGMPPPNSSFRWCTDKLKKMPSDFFIAEHFGSTGFITITGARRSESIDRAISLQAASRPGTNLKFNSRYANASNLTPIEHWSVKDVWSYLFSQKSIIVDIVDPQKLWDLYSDASGKASDECSFVGAGGKEIDEGKIGCGVSRFGCWQCYVTRNEDKALGGLLKSGYKDIDLYVEYRNWFWGLTQRGWSLVRDVYRHDNFARKMYTQGGVANPKYGMTQARGLRLCVRIAAFKRIIALQAKLQEQIISTDEVIEIQKRWLLEGDINLTAFSVYVGSKKQDTQRKADISIALVELRTIVISARRFLKNELAQIAKSKIYSNATLKRMAVQKAIGADLSKQFYPTISEERIIRAQWKRGVLSVEEQIEAMKNEIIKIAPIETLFGKGIDRDKMPEHLHVAANKYLALLPRSASEVVL